MTAAVRLRELIESPSLLMLPGAFDALTARVLEETGYGAVYATGAGIVNAGYAWPDLGLLGMSEVTDAVRRIADATGLPVVADADTGFGGALNVARTVREMERAGAVAVQIEDQVAPKRCGHFAGKAVVGEDEMLGRLRAAMRARQDAATVIVARTDAADVLGIDAAIVRARRCADAGADLVFVESPGHVEDLVRIPAEVPAPTLVNVVEGGRTPQLDVQEYERMGFAVALYANLALRLAVQAVRDGMAELRRAGTSEGLAARTLPWDERQRLVRRDEHDDFAARLVADSPPTTGEPSGPVTTTGGRRT